MTLLAAAPLSNSRIEFDLEQTAHVGLTSSTSALRQRHDSHVSLISIAVVLPSRPRLPTAKKERNDDQTARHVSTAVTRRSARASMLNRPAPNTTTTRANTQSATFKS
jgi:hypothetical protein